MNDRVRGLLFTIALTAGGLPPAAASQHIVEMAWDAAGRFEPSSTVAAGRFVEVCGELKPGDVVRWTFKATAPLDFNVHYHVGKATEYPMQQVQVGQGEGELRVSLKETYCWMWTNQSDRPVRVDLQLRR